MQWKKVKDEKPPYDTEVIVHLMGTKETGNDKHSFVRTVTLAWLIKEPYGKDTEVWVPSNPALCEYDVSVSHWMHLPDFPKDLDQA
jgi:hypothetical protein